MISRPQHSLSTHSGHSVFSDRITIWKMMAEEKTSFVTFASGNCYYFSFFVIKYRQNVKPCLGLEIDLRFKNFFFLTFSINSWSCSTGCQSLMRSFLQCKWQGVSYLKFIIRAMPAIELVPYWGCFIIDGPWAILQRCYGIYYSH